MDCRINNCRLKFRHFWNVFERTDVCVWMLVCVCLKLEGFIYLFPFFSAFHTENKKRPSGLEAKTPSSILICLTQSPYCIYFPEASSLPSFLFLINTYKTILLEVAIQLKYLWKAYLPWVPMFPCSSVHFFPAFFVVIFSVSYNLFHISRKTMSWRLWSVSFIMQVMWRLNRR